MIQRRFYSLLATLALIGFPLLASGHNYQVDAIRIVHPWATPTVSAITDGATSRGYLVLRNTGRKPDKLLTASTEIAQKVELRAGGEMGDASTAHPVQSIEIPADGEVRLKPNGPHLMLIDLEQPLEEGQHFWIVLEFERAGKISVEMFVQKNAKSAIY